MGLSSLDSVVVLSFGMFGCCFVSLFVWSVFMSPVLFLVCFCSFCCLLSAVVSGSSVCLLPFFICVYMRV